MEGRLADFEMRGVLGAGAFGEVHEAFDRRRNARVALKRLRHRSAADLYRFKNEFRALADISHPNIVGLHELFADGNDWYIAMELVEGIDIVSYIRNDAFAFAPTVLVEAAAEDGAPELADDLNFHRLRASFAQLAAGVNALHDAKRLHRDLKPSNVLVAKDGTVKILDFGLVTELTDASESLAQIVGTPRYMAPEQGSGEDVTAASDWYAVGALLYEALSGRAPFDGEDGMAILLAKRASDPPDPRSGLERLPAELCELSMALLRRDPSSRPPPSEIARVLNVASTSTPSSPSSRAPHSMLFGRARELGTLAEAYAASRRGASIVVHVSGPSGNGKTALLRSFLEDLAARDEAVVLDGRCYEGEEAPFKAVDTVMSAAARRLASLPVTELVQLVPRDFDVLVRLFPALQRIKTRLPRQTRDREFHDPLESRRRGFAAVRDMVGRLADRRPVVVSIDDCQWGDIDSVRLLADLVQSPDAPPLLLILSYRSESAQASFVLQTFREHVRGEQPVFIELNPLARDAAFALARALVDPLGGMAEGDIKAIVDEAKGSPFFVHELAYHIVHGSRRTDDVTLDALISRRFQQLNHPERDLLEVISIAATAIGVDIVRTVTCMPGEIALTALANLKTERLVRTRRDHETEVVETYHDRIRERVSALLDPGRRRQLHGLIAGALTAAESSEHDVIALHYRASDNPTSALPHMQLAAVAASNALAFERASSLCKMIVEMTPIAVEGALAARIAYGDALVRAGRGAKAAEAYVEASRLLPTGERGELLRMASEQLVMSGHLQRGLLLLDESLARAGLSLTTPVRALFKLLYLRIYIYFRGTQFRPRPEAMLLPADMIRADACASATAGLLMIDNLQSALFTARALLFALRLGSSNHVTRAILAHATFEAMAARSNRGRRRAALFLEQGARLAERGGRPDFLALAAVGQGVSSMMVGAWTQTAESFGTALKIYGGNKEPDSMSSKLADVAEIFLLRTEVHLGDFARAEHRRTRLRREARDRGDRFLDVTINVGHGTFIDLARDEPQSIPSGVSDAVARWSARGYSQQDMYALLSLALMDLYERRAESAIARVERDWPHIRSSRLLRIASNETAARYLRALVHLSRLSTPSSGRSLSIARNEGSHLSKLAPWARCLQIVINGAAAGAEGDRATWRAALERAISQFDALEMSAYAAAARFRLGKLVGGDDGRRLVETSTERLHASGVRRPDRFVTVLVPDPLARHG